MPKIDFYILPEADANARLQFACRLIEKAHQQKHRIYIHAADEQEAHHLDELLWTYREDSFLPHNLVGEGPEPAPPIQIGFQSSPEKHRDILINLSQDIPAFFKQFQRIIEMVRNEPQAVESARERFRQYKSEQCAITTHKLQTTE